MNGHSKKPKGLTGEQITDILRTPESRYIMEQRILKHYQSECNKAINMLMKMRKDLSFMICNRDLNVPARPDIFDFEGEDE